MLKRYPYHPDIAIQLAQASQDPFSALSLLERGGVIGLLLFFIVGGLRGWWVFGRHHAEVIAQYSERLALMTEDRDYWRDIATQGIEAARDAVSVAERRHDPRR